MSDPIEFKFERKVYRNATTCAITIPSELVAAMNISPGDTVVFSTTDSSITFSKKKMDYR